MKRFVLLLWVALAAFPAGALCLGNSRTAEDCVMQRRSERRHRGYVKDDWTVWYQGRKVEGAVASSFADLGGGYGKDNWKVFYAGREVKGAVGVVVRQSGRRLRQRPLEGGFRRPRGEGRFGLHVPDARQRLCEGCVEGLFSGRGDSRCFACVVRGAAAAVKPPGCFHI